MPLPWRKPGAHPTLRAGPWAALALGAALAWAWTSSCATASGDDKQADAEPQVPSDAGPRCGDDDVDVGEECDPGAEVDLACAYGVTACEVCDAACRLAPGIPSWCGDGVRAAGVESCDDGNTVTEVCAYDQTRCTVCDATCAEVAGEISNCGDLHVDAPDEGCDDGNTLTERCAYGAASCTVCNGACEEQPGETSACGDGFVDVDHEGCDDGNTAVEACAYGLTSCSVCGGACQPAAGVAHFCGDGQITAADGEACEDLNAVAGDGCTPACQRETFEIEPNEDGSPATGGTATNGNDFAVAHADANGALDPAAGPIHLVAALAPTGDEDVYALRSAAARSVTLETFVGGYAACPATAADTVITIRDAAGVELARDDDGGPERCSRLVYALPAATTVYVHAIEYGDDAALGRYFLVVQ